MGLFDNSEARIAELRNELRTVNSKLDAILDALHIEYAETVNPQITDLLAQGKKIEAIKVYREQTGVGLAEAKNYIESL